MSTVNINVDVAAEASAGLVKTCNVDFLERLQDVAVSINKIEDGELKDTLIGEMRKMESVYNDSFLPKVDEVKKSIDGVPEFKAAFQKAINSMTSVKSRSATMKAEELDPSAIHI